MFPNIPRTYIVRELDRADGVVPIAIDRLLLLVPDFMNLNEDESSLDTSPVARSEPSTHHNLMKSIHDNENDDGVEERSDLMLTKKNWDSVDTKTRQRILMEKKKEMILKAREAFLSQNQKQE